MLLILMEIKDLMLQKINVFISYCDRLISKASVLITKGFN